MKVAESKLTDANLISLPSAVRKALKMVAGDYLEWHIEDNGMQVKKREKKDATD